MSGFFSDDEDDSLPQVRRQPQPPQRARPHNAKASSSRGVSREASLVSETSLGEPSFSAGGSSSREGGSGSRSFLARLESTLSPRSERYSASASAGPTDSERGMDFDNASIDLPIPGQSLRTDDMDGLENGTHGLNGDDGDGEDEGELDDVKRLGRAWVKERGTVDLMRWEGDLIDVLFDKLEQQVSGGLIDRSRLLGGVRAIPEERIAWVRGKADSALVSLVY